MFSYFLKASLLAVILGGSACQATTACLEKRTCINIASELDAKCFEAGDKSPCAKAGEWLNSNCINPTGSYIGNTPACFADMTCQDLQNKVFNTIGSPNGDVKYQNIGYDFIVQNCTDQK